MRGTWTMAAAGAAAMLGLVLAGCGSEAPDAGTGGDGPREATADATPSATLPGDLFLGSEPEGGVDVAALKKTAKEGEEVVLVGRIGGNRAPFVAGRAVMTLADPALVPCNEMSMEDECPLPWDYCCEERGVLTASTATVEVDGPDGRPLRTDLKGAGGLEELKTVVVVGTVAPRPDPAVLVVRAKGIFVR